MRNFIVSFPLIVVLLLVCSCTGEQTNEAPIPANPIPPAFIFEFPVEWQQWHPHKSITLRWRINDPTVTGGRIHYRAEKSSLWRALADFGPGETQVTVDLPDKTDIRYRFSITTRDNTRRDSSAVVQYLIPFLVEPREGSSFVVRDSILLRWENVADDVQEVEIQYSPRDRDQWVHVMYAPAGDGFAWFTNHPFAPYTAVDFRIRARGSLLWAYTRNVGIGVNSARFPVPERAVYRLLPMTIFATLGIPPTSDATLTSYELSVDGGSNWTRIQKTHLITEKATANALVRINHPALVEPYVLGPFSIVDRVHDYFQPFVGMRLQYDFNRSSSGYGGGTPMKRRLIVTVLSVQQQGDRVEYSCSLLYIEENGTQHTATGMLWHEENAFRSIRGNFDPFLVPDLPAIHDITINTFRKQFSMMLPGSTSKVNFDYTTERYRGLVFLKRDVKKELPSSLTTEQWRLVE